MTLYLAGPMTGVKDFNFPAFREAARALRAQGYRVVSPHELTPDTSQPKHVYLKRDLLALLERCDSLVLLPGWESSSGATLERAVARALQYTIYEWVDGELV